MITVDYISTNGDCIFACQNGAGTSFNTSVTQYFGLSGSLVSGQSTETSAQVTGKYDIDSILDQGVYLGFL
jgi:hypothetical protein